MSRRSARVSSGCLLALAQELPVHNDEQLLAVLPKARVTADRLDHVQAGLVVPAADRQVAQQPRQRAGLQLQGALQVGHLRRDGQRATHLPLRHGCLADPGRLAKLTLRQALFGARFDQRTPELLLLRCGRQGCCSRWGIRASTGVWRTSGAESFRSVPTWLDHAPTTLYRRAVSDPRLEPCRG